MLDRLAGCKMWQTCNKLKSLGFSRVSEGTLGTFFHTTVCGVRVLILCAARPRPPSAPLSHTSLSHTVFHTHHSSPTTAHNFLTHHLSHTALSHTCLSHTIFHAQPCHNTHLFVTHTHTLSHTIFHTQLCHIPLCHKQLCHTQLCHTPSFTHNFVRHNFVTHNFATHNFVTHTLCHTPSFTHTCSEQSLRIIMWNASYVQKHSSYT